MTRHIFLFFLPADRIIVRSGVSFKNRDVIITAIGVILNIKRYESELYHVLRQRFDSPQAPLVISIFPLVLWRVYDTHGLLEQSATSCQNNKNKF